MRIESTPACFSIVVFVLVGCNTSEISRLQVQNDSLRNVLQIEQTAVTSLQEVTMWLDSIDASRNLLLTDLRDGARQPEVSERLRGLKEFVRMTEEKITVIQNALRSSKVESSAYLMLVDALRSEVQLRVDELIKLNEHLGTYKEENAVLEEAIKMRENEAKEIGRVAAAKEQELLLLEARVQAMVNNFKIAEGDACYARARALEEAARRTRLAPQKKRATYKEALELYKKASSLGVREARADIARLEGQHL